MNLTPPIKAWSFSRLLQFEKCPYSVYLESVVKAEKPDLPEDNPLIRGIRIHEAAEAFIKNEGELIRELTKPKIVDHLEICKDAYEQGTAEVEESWGFDETWGVTGWWDDNVWCRIKLDVKVDIDEETVDITDWKSGKSAGKEVRDMQQGQLYAIGVFMHEPAIEYVQPTFAYIDENKIITKNPIRRADIPRYIARFKERADKLTTCTDFRAKPNRMNCRYCDFGPNGTQACVHGVS